MKGGNMKIDKDKLKNIATPLTDQEKRCMTCRKSDRYWKAASSAIAAKVLRQLKVLGKTRMQLAEDLGVTPANITRYLNGRCNFELKTLIEMERVLNIKIIDRNVIPVKEQKTVQIIIGQSYGFNSASNDCNQPDLLLDSVNNLEYYG